MRATLPELAIDSLMGRVGPNDPDFVPPEEAWAILREEGPQDFGDDLAKWDAWVDREFRIRRRKARDATDSK